MEYGLCALLHFFVLDKINIQRVDFLLDLVQLLKKK